MNAVMTDPSRPIRGLNPCRVREVETIRTGELNRKGGGSGCPLGDTAGIKTVSPENNRWVSPVSLRETWFSSGVVRIASEGTGRTAPCVSHPLEPSCGTKESVSDADYGIDSVAVEGDGERRLDSLELFPVVAIFADHQFGAHEAGVTKVVEAAVGCGP